MNFLKQISDYLETIITIKSEYIYLIFISIFIIFFIKFCRFIILSIFFKKPLNSKEKYIYNKTGSTLATSIIFVLLTLVWMNYLKNFLTIITFVSTAITLSLKDIIFNFFSGIYIKTSKLFSLEDRIEINDLKGDVVNINKTGFDLLEIGDRVNGEQSTGRIVHVPNSIVFTYPIKSYVKGFKYIWNEIKVCVPLDEDVLKVKELLLQIVIKNSNIKDIPKKMKDEVNTASTDYRIYFNNLDPIVYISVIDGHIELYIRFLVHPKMVRNVENAIWLDILDEQKNGNITLHR